MTRILALDFGSRTIGVAESDPLRIIATPLKTLRREREGKLRASLREIVAIVKSHNVGMVVLGYPLNMDDSRGERAIKTEKFKADLEYRFIRADMDIPVILWDERLSTVEAQEVLDESAVSKRDQKEVIDSLAAVMILEDYLKNGKKEN